MSVRVIFNDRLSVSITSLRELLTTSFTELKIGLFTDAPKHNLAIMKLATVAKINGHQIYTNFIGKFDLTIGSWLFDWSEKQITDIEGGTGIDPSLRLFGFDDIFPDYSIVKGLDYFEPIYLKAYIATLPEKNIFK